jgi:2-iminobutanoate/2-iminopropanoate deaminase
VPRLHGCHAHGMSNSRHRVISSNQAPPAIGPYVQGVKTAGSSMVFLSGQLGLDPVTQQLSGSDVASQARTAISNALSVLAEVGAGKQDVVKATVFLADMSQYADFNRVYQELFDPWFPARSVVGVAALPLGALVEVELVAAMGTENGDA